MLHRPALRASAGALLLAASACNPPEGSTLGHVAGQAAGDAATSTSAPAGPSPAGPSSVARHAAAPPACTTTRSGAAADAELASCLSADVVAPGAAGQGTSRPVVLYVDRSGSMRGFLDPAFPTHTTTDFRAVLDRLVVGLHPAAGFSYGGAVQSVTPSLATFDDRAFYADHDTRVEEVLARIAADTGHTRTHILVGDARRGSPTAADAQFVGMRDLAERWTQAGGTFLVGATMAPFRTVTTDPSGCRADQPNNPRQTCPLYAFAFVAPGADDQVRTALAESFEHVFAWPMAPIAPAALAVTPAAPVAGVDVNRHWAAAPGGAAVIRVTGTKPAAQWATLQMRVADTSAPDGRVAAAFLAGQGTTARVLARPFQPAAAGMAWQPVGAGAPIRATPGTGLALDVITRGATAPAGLYRADFMPQGEPSWLGAFDASDAHDRLRTYGLGRLFEATRQQAAARARTDSAAVARLLFVIN